MLLEILLKAAALLLMLMLMLLVECVELLGLVGVCWVVGWLVVVGGCCLVR